MAKHFVRMSLQLYQVDYKSFLLDFKSLPNDDDNKIVPDSGEFFRDGWRFQCMPCLMFVFRALRGR